MKTPFRRILGYNLPLILATAVILRLPFWSDGMMFGRLIIQAAMVVILLIWNVGSALTDESEEVRRAHWLGLLLVLLIGIGTCALPGL